MISSVRLDRVDIYLGDGSFSSDLGNVNSDTSKGSHWVVNINEIFFDSFGCATPQKLSKFLIKRIGQCLFSKYKIRGMTSEKDFYCAVYCFCINYLIKFIEIEFKSAVLNLYYQRYA